MDRSIYLCHFLRAIDETFVQKFFGQIGKIKQIHFGVYKNKACNKRKKRTIYFAIIVFKHVEDCQKCLDDPKYLQKIVNKTTKKHVKTAFDDFDSDHEEGAPLTETQQHEKDMEDGGFTLVREGADTIQSKKSKVSDGNHTTMVGISQEEMQKIYRQSLKRGVPIQGLDSDEEEQERQKLDTEEAKWADTGFQHEMVDIEGLPKLYNNHKKVKKEKEGSGLYAHQTKQSKKEELISLQTNFEEYKRRLAKKIQKDKNRQQQLMRF